MNDTEIVRLFWERNEQAILETKKKYDAYCLTIARSVLQSRQDADEAAQDTWLAAWNSIPPQRPVLLKTYLGKLTRRIALKRYRRMHALKRGAGEMPLVLDELTDCLASSSTVEDEVDGSRLTEAINRFLEGLKAEERSVFICRYWYLDSIEAIGKCFGFSTSKVKALLRRLRLRLRSHLESEGFWDEE